MPIRQELRKFYRGKEWEAIRARIIKRDNRRCQQCHKPMNALIFTYKRLDPPLEFGGKPVRRMVWVKVGGKVWRNEHGKPCSLRSPKGLPEKIHVSLGVAHLDGNPRNRADDNLRLLCNWCHIMTDRGQHHNSRCDWKDPKRPLLLIA